MSSNTTKQALEAALKRKLLQKPLDKITIRDITEDCGISRMAFYYHFKDIYDLVEWACVEDAAQVLQGKKTYDTWHEGLEQIFEAVLENKAFVLNACRCISRDQMERFLFKLTYGLIRDVVEEKSQGVAIAEADKAFIAEFYKYSFVGVMLDWIRQGMQADYRIIVRKVVATMQGNIVNSIQNFAAQSESLYKPGPVCKWRMAAKRSRIKPQSDRETVKTVEYGKVAVTMAKHLGKLTAAAAGLAGAGAAVVLAKKAAQAQKLPEAGEEGYRNTELGRHEKNSKGIYYSNGNYEAFARPEKPEGVEEKHAYLVGSGLAALAAACFLVRDGQMPGSHIHILEAMDVAGGACDGIYDPARGYVMRGGREMENHFECLWDLFRSIPSLEKPGASVLDEFYWLNKHDPNYSLCRATVNRGQDAHTDGKFNLSQKGCMEIVKLFLTPDEDLYDKTIEDVFDDEVFSSTFWLYWRTMFAFENWHSALEMKLYFQRFIHHIAGLPDFSALKFTRYNQYESLILPMQKYLEAAGVDFRFGTEVTNVLFDIRGGKKIATAIECKVKGVEQGIVLTENDLVFVTNGSCTEGTIYGDQDHAPNGDAEVRTSGCWSLWKNIAKQDPSFGRPEKFCSDVSKTNWESATITTLDDKILPYITNICKRDPRTGKVVTGGIVSCQDSKWLLSWTINRQGQFKEQDPEKVCIWVYGLFTDVPGDYVKKPMKECTGREITEEWLYHIGVPVEQIDQLARESAVCVPTMMPYITAFFMPRAKGDRPDVIPDGCVNFAFLGQFAETPRDTVFTTEYSVRTAMEAVYGLLGVDRGVPEVWGSVYDIRALLDSSVCLMDGKSPLDMELPGPLNLLKKPALKMIRGTVVEKILREHHIIR